MPTAAKAAIYERLRRLYAGQLFDLFERRLQRRAIIGIAARRVNADYPARLRGRYHLDFAAELVLLVRLALGNTFDFRRMHTIDLLLVGSLLLIDVPTDPQQLGVLLLQRADETLDIAQHPPQIGAQLLGLFAGAFELLRTSVSALASQLFLAQAGIALPQLAADLPRHSHQGATSLVIQPRVSRKGNGFLLHRRIDVDALHLFIRERL